MAYTAKARKVSKSKMEVSELAPRRDERLRIVVPWSSSDEWMEIRQKILDNSQESMGLALSRLRIWQLRCEAKKCPAFVEATIHLLRALVADRENADTSEVLSIYGEAINKFVQIILERASKTGENLQNQNKNMAESLQIPQWIVDVRNDAIHHFRGSLPLYRTTANTLFDWLKQNYWAEEKRESAASETQNVAVTDGLFQEYIQLALNAKSATERSLAEAALSNLRATLSASRIQSFISHLVELEALTSVEKSRSTHEIPSNYKSAYLPIFALLEDNLTTLFTSVLKTLSLPVVVCSEVEVDKSMQTVVQWISWLSSGTAVWKGKDLATRLNLKKILQVAATVVSQSTPSLLEICIEKMDPPLSEEKADFVRKLFVAFSGERARTCGAVNGFEKMTVCTVEHVVAERANREKLNKQRLPSTPRVDWSVVPLGFLPESAAVGDLYLDVNIKEDFVPLDVETEDEAVLKYERKFLEEKSQNQEIKPFNEDVYEAQRNALAVEPFKLWKIPNTQMMVDDERDYDAYGVSQL
ncbi:uncharacterized protein LOC100908154 [Galendromus occidentalis]|uniref:Uncharacterized protein LOC100908154 n=1 Tax=Galendromus occidentalis TaxID=34638 RepID=A0AAJ7L6Z6_9ACAR|nr:uncharacterized protein LOC100908154 [Galendromus occidentalis]